MKTFFEAKSSFLLKFIENIFTRMAAGAEDKITTVPTITGSLHRAFIIKNVRVGIRSNLTKLITYTLQSEIAFLTGTAAKDVPITTIDSGTVALAMVPLSCIINSGMGILRSSIKSDKTVTTRGGLSMDFMLMFFLSPLIIAIPIVKASML